MSRRRPVVALACLALTSAAAAVITAAPASATTALPGSILYVKANNIYATDGVTTRTVTSNGGTVSADGKGSSGYLAPSQTDDGKLVVAVRNQKLTSGNDQQTYYHGYLWVMDAYGHVIRKIDPPQFAYAGTQTCGLPTNAPQGIFDAQVSPDGRYIAYTPTQLFEKSDCSGAGTGYGSTVIDITGANAWQVKDDGGDSADLEIGSWASSTTLLADRADFGSQQIYRFTMPGATSAHWFGQGPDWTDWTDGAYQVADYTNGVVATSGFSPNVSGNVVRISTSSNWATPAYRCERSGVATTDWLGNPSLSPDGSTVVYTDTPNGSTTSRGIYTMSTGSCADQTLLVAGGDYALWSPAPIDPAPVVVVGSHPTNPSRSTSASIAFTVSHSGAVTTTCRLDGGTAHACTSPVSFTGLANGVHTVTVTASGAHGQASATYSWRVDTSVPTVRLNAPTAPTLLGSSVTATWSGSDTGSGIAGYQLQQQRAPYNGNYGAWTNLGGARTSASAAVGALAAGYRYCLRVRATDRAGNVSYSNPRCFAVALDDRSLTPATSGWARATSTAYYLHTATTTTKLGAKLVRAGANMAQIGLVASTCSTCGTVGIYVGSTLISKVSLAAASHNKVIKLSPRFSLRTGSVTLKVLTSGKKVTVDGLLLMR